MYNIPYSRKYWRELNLVVGFQIAIAKVLSLAVRLYTPYVYKRVADFNLAVAQAHEQTAKPPNLIPCQIFRLYVIHQFPYRSALPNIHARKTYLPHHNIIHHVT